MEEIEGVGKEMKVEGMDGRKEHGKDSGRRKNMEGNQQRRPRITALRGGYAVAGMALLMLRAAR